MKILKIIVPILLILTLTSCSREEAPVIDEERIVTIEIKHHTFDNQIRTTKLQVLDVTADSVKKIFEELFKNNFSIYDLLGYENRKIVNGTRASLHAYGGAIDVNPHINPYYDALKGAKSIKPERFIKRKRDEKEIRDYLQGKDKEEVEIDAVIKTITQEPGSDDWFINRDYPRKGMITKKEAKIFTEHGFITWGGMWRQPMDFMHFQIPRKLAEKLASIDKKEGEVVFANHVLISKWSMILKNKLANLENEEKKSTILKDHFEKCLKKPGYLSAADKKETTDICVNDTVRKIAKIGS